jgi:glycerol-3-phosphate acyltransferase PlsY
MVVLGPLLLLLIYLVGTVPVGLVVARAQGVDITAVGSKSVGATNVARSVGKVAGIITLIGDVLKGVVGVSLGSVFFDSSSGPAIAGFFVVAGHCFSLPPVLKGGKGVATALGAILMLYPLAALFGIVTFSISFLLSKIVSLSSLIAAITTPLVVLATGGDDAICNALIAIAALVTYRHHQNIDRLMKGTEPTFSTKK